MALTEEQLATIDNLIGQVQKECAEAGYKVLRVEGEHPSVRNSTHNLKWMIVQPASVTPYEHILSLKDAIADANLSKKVIRAGVLASKFLKQLKVEHVTDPLISPDLIEEAKEAVTLG